MGQIYSKSSVFTILGNFFYSTAFHFQLNHKEYYPNLCVFFAVEPDEKSKIPYYYS